MQFWEWRRLPMFHVGWQPAVRTARRMAPRGSVPSRFISTSTFRLNARARARTLRRASLPVHCEPSDGHRQFSPLYSLDGSKLLGYAASGALRSFDGTARSKGLTAATRSSKVQCMSLVAF